HAISDSPCDSSIATSTRPSQLEGRMLELWLRLRLRMREDVLDHVIANRAVEVTYEALGGLGYRIVATSQQSAAMSERIGTLEWDNMRLRGITMPTATRSGMTQYAINELIAKHVKKALNAYDAAKNLATETKMENDQQDDNVEANLNNGNDNGNGNGNPNVNNEAHINSHKRTVGVDAAYAITWKALMKLMTERFQDLTLLCIMMVPKEEDKIKKYIGGLLDSIQGNVIAAEPVRLQDAIRIANNLMDHKLKGYTIKNSENIEDQNIARAYTVGNNVKRRGYARVLPYCNKCKMHHKGPCMVKCGTARGNEIQKMETGFWNLTVKEEEDKIKKYIGGLLDSIQGNVIAAEPVRLQDAIRIANNLMDHKLKGYTIKNSENIEDQNIARAYTVGNNVERRGYARVLPYCNKCIMHHKGPCMVKCGTARGQEILAMSVEGQNIIEMSVPS
nr:hypothetical protein [Tanacetum cinerariifolium]